MKNKLNQHLFILLFAGCALNMSAFAQPQGIPSHSDGDWDIRAGGGMMVKPTYEGSSEYDIWPIPYFEFEYKNSLKITPRGGITYESKLDNGLSWSVGTGFDFGRDEDDGDLLEGMGAIDFSGGLRVGVDYDFGPLSAGVSVSKALIGDHNGIKSTVSIGKNWLIREWKSMVSIRLHATFADDEYLDTYFGVDSVQSVSSGYSTYSLDSGLKDVGVNALWVKRLNRDWSIMGMLNYSNLVGDVADSPVVDSQNQFFGGIFAIRSF